MLARTSRMKKNVNERMLMDRLGEPKVLSIFEKLEQVQEEQDGTITHRFFTNDVGTAL